MFKLVRCTISLVGKANVSLVFVKYKIIWPPVLDAYGTSFQYETGLELVFIGFSALCKTVPRPRLALVLYFSQRLERRLRYECVLIWPILQNRKVRN